MFTDDPCCFESGCLDSNFERSSVLDMAPTHHRIGRDGLRYTACGFRTYESCCDRLAYSRPPVVT
jgi:hypothetical protein